MNDEFLTINEYAAQENVSRRTVQRWLSAGLIFGIKIKGRIYIPADEVSPQLLDTGKYIPEEEELGGGSIPDEPEEEEEETGEEEEEECEPCPCDTPDGIEVQPASYLKKFPPEDVRHISFQHYEDAVNWADPIVPPTIIFRRAEDCRYQVVIDYA